MNLIKGDCIVELKKLPDKSIDFFYLDLPYGQTACKWDNKVDHKALWIELRRLAKSERTPFFFSCTTKFGFELYNTAPKGWFRWDLVWKKNRAAGFLNAYKLPMRKHEMIYCFAKKTPDYDVSSNLTGEEKTRKPSINDKYLTQFQNKGSLPTYEKPHKSKVLSHPLPTSDITPPTEEHELVYCFAKKSPDYDVSSHKEYEEGKNAYSRYSKVYGKNENFVKVKVHKDPLPTSDITPPTEEHELVYCFAKKSPDYDVSSHKEYTEQKEYNSKLGNKLYGSQKDVVAKLHKQRLPTSDITPPTDEHELVYCFAKRSPDYDLSSHKEYTTSINNSKNDKFLKEATSYFSEVKDYTSKSFKDPLPNSDITPSSWCEYKLDTKIDHRTAKPIKLMEFLLKYWTKEGDTVCDPTAGSGSMGVACKNMNRKFIGIEKDDDIYTLMCDRINNIKPK